MGEEFLCGVDNAFGGGDGFGEFGLVDLFAGVGGVFEFGSASAQGAVGGEVGTKLCADGMFDSEVASLLGGA